MRTEIILFTRPSNGGISLALPVEEIEIGWSQRGVGVSTVGNPNQNNRSLPILNAQSGEGRKLDLYEDVEMPLNFSIIDVREPDKRKTSWSKTIKVPGTNNNNRIFQHIYQISGDGWITIGNTSVYTNFNPSLRREVIIKSDGVQVIKGNLQLKGIRKDSLGKIEYDIIISGDLTSLFFDIGEAKLSDLDFSEWDHDWSKESITQSWNGIVKKGGQTYSNSTLSSLKDITRVDVQALTKRCIITTSTTHGYAVGEFINLNFFYLAAHLLPYLSMNGTWVVTQIISSTKFVVNHQFPGSLNSVGNVIPPGIGECQRQSMKGEGYVYPLISWGDEYDYNTWGVSNMVPSYFMKEIWDKIFEKTGSTYDSDFLDSEFFKRLILTQKKAAFDLTTAQISTRLIDASSRWAYLEQPSINMNADFYVAMGVTSSIAIDAYKASGSIPANNPSRIRFDLENVDGLQTATSSGSWINDTWLVSNSGEYDINVLTSISSWIDIDGVVGGAFNGTASISFVQKPYGAQIFGPYVGTGPYYPGGAIFNNGVGPKLTVTLKLNVLRAGQVTKLSEVQSTFNLLSTSPQTLLSGNGALTSNFADNYRLGYGRFQPTSWLTRTLNINHKSCFLKTGDQVYVTVTENCSGIKATDSPSHGVFFRQLTKEYMTNEYDWDDIRFRGKWLFKIQPQARIYNVPSPKASEGSVILGTDFLPKDMTCKDFLKNIIKMFNLHIEADRQIEKKYYIEPRDDYYYTGANGATDYVDWSTKLDPNTVEITPLGELLSRYYTFTNKTETDYWNNRFKNERGRDYMLYKKEVVNDFLKNETKIEVTFGSTVMINNPEDSDVVMPAVLQIQDGVYKPASNSAARVLMWVGKKPYTTGRGSSVKNLNLVPDGRYGWELLSSVAIAGAASGTSSNYEYYPYAGTCDSPEDPYYDINWFNIESGDFVYWDYARFTDNNLYNRFWKNFIDEVSDPSSMVVKASFHLTPKDIYNLDFKKIYVVDGVYYRLQKIMDYNPVVESMTKVELLKLKAPTKFIPKSVPIDQSFDYVIDNTRPIQYLLNSAAPKVKSIRDGEYTNVVPTGMGSAASVQVKGSGNWVGDSKNISISGNECFVGAGSQNINIQSSGVFVAGGLSNISVIGTNKIIISESDVSYINGVRYKNGVAVSRANIIDAGLYTGTSSVSGISLQRGKNTTVSIDVIDAGDDLVIDRGSKTYENIIEPGLNAILPDIPELGISTMNVPSPKTNLSGGYLQNTGTSTMAEVIRSTNEYL